MPSRIALVNAAEREIAALQAITSGTCAVLWQRPAERAEAFGLRVTIARERLPDERLLIVVCGPDTVAKRTGVCVVELPPVMLGLFDKLARYRCCYGGRGAGRSWAFARALLVRALERRVRILCAREFQNSIADSIHTLLADQIETLGLGAFFEVQATTIYARNGSEFIFSGIRNNVTRIKSLEGANICFVEEAQGITDQSWQILIPTIRTAGSEIWAAWNPDLEGDPTHVRFVLHPPDSAVVIKTDYSSNPWFPETLKAECEYLARVDADAHAHVWLGECRRHSDAQVFKGKFVAEAFDAGTGWSGPFFGADWGFAQDPTTLVKCWVHERTLFVEYEAYGVSVDIDRTPALFDTVPGARNHVIGADSARPETISYMKRSGYPQMASVAKWSGSVEDGVAHLRSYEKIVVHPRCIHALEEMRLFSYKVDRLSGDVLADLEPGNDHCIDSIRYALGPLIKQSGATAFLGFLSKQSGADAKPALVQQPGVTVQDLTNPWQ
jgi:phage terminase large subunit